MTWDGSGSKHRPVYDSENITPDESALLEKVAEWSRVVSENEAHADYGSDVAAYNAWEERQNVSAFVRDETAPTYAFLMNVVRYAIAPIAFIATVAVATGLAILIWRLVNV